MGQRLVQALIDTGRFSVRVFDVRPCPVPGVESVVGDLRNPEDVVKALNGIAVVFHVATAAPTGENATNKALMTAVNVDGTANLIDACKSCGVDKLIYTSSASVVFSGKALVNVDETLPYAEPPQDYYTKTKLEAEKLVLQANSQKLATCALRPSGIFGPGDQLTLPTIIGRAQKGKLWFIMGDGSNMMSWTYVDNVASALVQAADALKIGNKIAGQAYFITNQQDYPFWDMLGDFCEGLGYKRPRVRLPVYLFLLVAIIFEYIIKPILSLLNIQPKQDITVFRILVATRHRTFSTKRAEADFGYVAKVPLKEGVRRTLESFSHLRAKEKAS